MTPGVSIFSQAPNATWSVNTGGADANYGIQNLADLINSCKPFRVTPAAGVAEIAFTLPAAASLQFFAMVRHTMTAGTIRLRLWSDNNPDPIGNAAHIVYDSTVVNIWPTPTAIVGGYSPTRPILLPNPLTIQSGLVTFGGLSGVPQIGGIEIAQFLGFDISEKAEFGFATDMADKIVMGGGAEAVATNLQRIANGQTDFLSTEIAAENCLDFMQTTATQTPFVFVQDYDDPTTWPRWCFLARNSTLPPLVGAIFGYDQFQFRFTEHIR